MLRSIIKASFKTLEHSKFSQNFTIDSYIKCSYSRWTHRRPSAIIEEDESFNADEEIQTPSKPISRRRRCQPNKNEKVAANEEKATIKKSIEGLPPIEILRNENIISSLMVKVKSRKKRAKNDLIFLEGFRLITDGIEAGAVPQVIMFSREADLKKLPLANINVKLYKIPYRTIQLWSNLDTSPGVIGIFRVPNVHDKKPAKNALPLTVICDNVRGPGNLGSILRAAAGVGCERVILTKGCVDLWDPKVIRSAAGAHFRVPITTQDKFDHLSNVVSPTADIFMADNNLHLIKDDTITEKHNASKEDDTEISNDASQVVNVNEMPLEHKNATSAINTDSAITLEEMESKLLGIQHTTYNFNKLAAKFDKTDFAFSNKAKGIIRHLTSQLPVEPYYNVDYTGNKSILVVSGETEGLSFPTLELLHERNGIRVNIPLSNGVDSLNNSIALSVVAFEIKRQFLCKNTT